MKNNRTKAVTNTVDMNKISRKQRNKRKQSEANARRKVAMNWDRIAHGIRYKKAATKEFCRRTTLLMEEELFDGILLNLKGRKASTMSYNKQKRILRRIVEKRQAQQAFRMAGRSSNRLLSHMQRQCVSASLNKMKRRQMCA